MTTTYTNDRIDTLLLGHGVAARLRVARLLDPEGHKARRDMAYSALQA